MSVFIEYMAALNRTNNFNMRTYSLEQVNGDIDGTELFNINKRLNGELESFLKFNDVLSNKDNISMYFGNLSGTVITVSDFSKCVSGYINLIKFISCITKNRLALIELYNYILSTYIDKEEISDNIIEKIVDYRDITNRSLGQLSAASFKSNASEHNDHALQDKFTDSFDTVILNYFSGGYPRSILNKNINSCIDYLNHISTPTLTINFNFSSDSKVTKIEGEDFNKVQSSFNKLLNEYFKELALSTDIYHPFGYSNIFKNAIEMNKKLTGLVNRRCNLELKCDHLEKYLNGDHLKEINYISEIIKNIIYKVFI